MLSITDSSIKVSPVGDAKTSSMGTSFEGSFDHVLGSEATQEEVYQKVGSNIAETSLKGFAVTVFAYGRTASGKTHTMQGGPGEARGLIPRILSDLFLSKTDELQVSLNYIELYNNQINDLLQEKKPAVPPKIRVTSKGQVQGIVTRVCETMEQVEYWNREGIKRLQKRATGENASSSRSHAILTVFTKNLTTGVVGKISLVDLAGSERVKDTKVQKEGLKEASHINIALSSLGNVVSSLHARRSHINYRESKLTLILQDSLVGQSVTHIIACISPDENYVQSTIATLRFASRCAKLEPPEIRRVPVIEMSSTPTSSLPSPTAIRSMPKGLPVSTVDSIVKQIMEQLKPLEEESPKPAGDNVDKYLELLKQELQVVRDSYETFLQTKVEEHEKAMVDLNYQWETLYDQREFEFNVLLRENEFLREQCRMYEDLVKSYEKPNESEYWSEDSFGENFCANF